MAVIEKRLEVIELDATRDDLQVGSELVTALCRAKKILPPRFLYDSRGRELYERLAALPEHYMRRTAMGVLHRHANEVARITGPTDIIELGADDIRRTRELLEAYRRPGRPQLYVPVVANPERALDSGPSLLRQYPDLVIHGLSGDGGSAMGALPPRQADTRLVVCLDNDLGKLTPEGSRALIKSLRRTLAPGDWFLAGVDLEAEPEILEAAYNDSEGLTAELNLNALHHINRYYGGKIDVGSFAHEVHFNAAEHRIEMHLRSEKNQVVQIPGLGFELELLEGHRILTEFSRKFTLSRVDSEFVDAGYIFSAAWADAKELYALFLYRAE